MKCNWKTYVDNYLEGYHLPSVHPGLNRELDFNAYVVEPYAHHVRQFSPIRGAHPAIRLRVAIRKRTKISPPITLDIPQLDAELLSRQCFAEHRPADRT